MSMSTTGFKELADGVRAHIDNYDATIEDLKNELNEAMKEIEDLTMKKGAAEEETKEVKAKLLSLQNHMESFKQQFGASEEFAKASDENLEEFKRESPKEVWLLLLESLTCLDNDHCSGHRYLYLLLLLMILLESYLPNY